MQTQLQFKSIHQTRQALLWLFHLGKITPVIVESLLVKVPVLFCFLFFFCFVVIYLAENQKISQCQFFFQYCAALLKNQICELHGNTKGKSQRIRSLVIRLHLLGTTTTCTKHHSVYPVIDEVFQTGTKLWTDHSINKHEHLQSLGCIFL